MMQRFVRALTPLLMILAALAIGACGSVATPEWAADAQSTRVALVATSDYMTSIAPTLTPTHTPLPTNTSIPTSTFIPTNTATPVPPTNTPVPPTETPVPPTAAAQTAPTGDSVNGQKVFTTTYTTAQGPWACSLCHTVSSDQARLIGPGLWGISERAASRVPGESAYDYIHTSIVNPQAFIVPPDAGGPYPENLMPQNWEQVLTPQELQDVIAYLYTLK